MPQRVHTIRTLTATTAAITAVGYTSIEMSERAAGMTLAISAVLAVTAASSWLNELTARRTARHEIARHLRILTTKLNPAITAAITGPAMGNLINDTVQRAAIRGQIAEAQRLVEHPSQNATVTKLWEA